MVDIFENDLVMLDVLIGVLVRENCIEEIELLR